MAVTINSQEAAGAGHRGTSTGVALTWSFTNTAGTLILMCITVTETTAAGGVAITQVRYNGVDMTDSGVSQSYGSGSNLSKIYYLLNPATGSNTASVTATGHGSFAVSAGMISFTGNKTSAPIGGTATGTGNSNHAVTSAGISAASSSYVVAVGQNGSADAQSPDSGWAETFELTGTGSTGGDSIDCIVKAGTGASITPGFTWTTADNWGIVAVEILADTGSDLNVNTSEPVIGGSTF